MISINVVFTGTMHQPQGDMLQLQVSRVPCMGERIVYPDHRTTYLVLGVEHYLFSHRNTVIDDRIVAVILCRHIRL